MMERMGCRVSAVAAPPGMRKLVRKDGDCTFVAVIRGGLSNGARLTPQMGRSICVQLGLKPADFGYRR